MSDEELVHDGAKNMTEAVQFSGIDRTSLYALMNGGRIRFCRHAAVCLPR